MLRKLLYGIFIALLGLFIFFLYLRMQHKTSTKIEENIFEFIPQDAGLIVHSKKPVTFLHQLHYENLVWHQLRKLPLFEETSIGLFYIDSLLTNGLGVDEDVDIESFSLSIHPKGDSKYSPLIVLELQSGVDESLAQRIFKNFYGEDLTLTHKAYNDYKVGTLRDTIGHYLGAYFVVNSSIVWSSSDILIEKCIGDIGNKNGVGNNASFNKIAATAGKKVVANVFVNFDNFGDIVGGWLNSEHYLSGDVLRKMGKWAALDLHTEGHSILLDGFMSYGEADEFMARFKNQDPVEFNAINIMPQNTRYFHCMGINNLDTYLLYYPNSIDAKKKLDAWSHDWEKQYGVPPIRLLRELLGGEIAKARTLDPQDKNTYLILKLQSNTTAQEFFTDFLKEAAISQKKAMSSYQKLIRVDDATTYTSYQFPIAEVVERYFGPLFPSEEMESVVFYDNFLVIGKNPSSLKSFLYKNLLGQTLMENQRFVEFSENLSSKSNFQMFTDFRAFATYSEQLFKPDFIKNQLGDKQNLNALNAFGFQLMGTNDNIYSTVYLDYTGERKEEAEAIWKSLLDTNFTQKPTLVENHYTHEKEIVVQDENMVLYLISPSGRIIWKKALGERILGRIFQVDVYKNGKLQLLFNTASKVHMLDRNGNYLKRYPLNLASKAVGGLGLIDYDKTRDYRIFVPCEDKSVQLYDKQGIKLKGWKFKGADYQVNSRINHFRVGSKDFVVFSDKSRVYLLNRQGQVRLRLKEQFSNGKNSHFYYDSSGPNGEPCIVTTDSKGSVKYIYFNGNVETKKFDVSSDDLHFLYADIDGDRREELIFMDGRKLRVFNEKGTRLFEYKFDRVIVDPPYLYEFSSGHHKIGIVDRKGRSIYLLNADGTTAKGFPLPGTTPFTLGFLKNGGDSFNLLVGGDSNFLYNYRVK